MDRGFSRRDRVATALQRELTGLIRKEVRDPRLGDVSVSYVKINRDLSHALVYMVSLAPDTIDDSLAALNKAAGFLRGRLGREMRMRSVPMLEFRRDDSADRGEHIESLLAQARDKDQR